MTVAELIEELKKQDPQAVVQKTNWEGHYPTAGSDDDFTTPSVFVDDEDAKLVWI